MYQDFHTFSQQPHQHGMSILQVLGSPGHRNGLRFVGCAYTAISRKGQGAFFAQSLSWGLFPVWTLVFSKIVCEVYRCIWPRASVSSWACHGLWAIWAWKDPFWPQVNPFFLNYKFLHFIPLSTLFLVTDENEEEYENIVIFKF
jgi:hypothetical protein